MRTAHFEIIHQDHKDDGNPYSATLVTDDPVPPDEFDLKRIKRLRNWLIMLTLAIVCLTILSYIAIGLFSAAEAPNFQEYMKRLNGTCVGTATVLLLPMMIVVYRLSRALDNSRLMSIVYLVFSSFMFHAGNQGTLFILPIGSVLIPFVLCIQTQNVLLEPPDETDFQPEHEAPASDK